MKKNSKSAKTVSLQESIKTGYINAKSQDDLLAEKILARIGRRQNEEWKQSNDDRQWW
jgi:hypothetical protein